MSILKRILGKAVEKKQQQQLTDSTQPDFGGGVSPLPSTPAVEVPASTDTTSAPAAGLGASSARQATAFAMDNAGVTAGEADVDVSASLDPSEIDPASGRRRPARAAFMSQGRGGAGLRV